MSAFNGWQALVTIQREPSLNATSSEPVYTLTGKTKLSQSVEFVGKNRTVNVWRELDTNVYSGKFFQGSIELELGFNEVVRLLLSGLFELKSQATESIGLAVGSPLMGEFGDVILGEGEVVFGEPASVGVYDYRPNRLNAISSFKIGVGFNFGIGDVLQGEGGGEISGEDGPIVLSETLNSILFSGVVIDSIRFDIRRNQIPKATINFKAIDRRPASYPVLPDRQNVSLNRCHHVNTTLTLNGQALSVAEINLTFNQNKTPTRFNTSKQPARFVRGNFDIAGQLVEYFGTDSLLPDAILSQNEQGLVFKLLDPAGTSRRIEFHFPRVNFNDALPDLVSRQELVSRASFAGLSYVEEDSQQPKILLVV